MQSHPTQYLMESRIFVEAVPLGRNGKMNEGGVVRLKCPFEMDKCRIEVPDGGGQYSEPDGECAVFRVAQLIQQVAVEPDVTSSREHALHFRNGSFNDCQSFRRNPKHSRPSPVFRNERVDVAVLPVLDPKQGHIPGRLKAAHVVIASLR